MRPPRFVMLALAATSFVAVPLHAQDAPEGAPAAQQSGERTVEAILADYEAAKPPVFDPQQRGDRAAIAKYQQTVRQVARQRANLALELYKKQPDHPQAAQMMKERWNLLSQMEPSLVMTETDELLKATPDSPLALDAKFYRARAAASSRDADAGKTLAYAEAFIESAPQDPRGARLLASVAARISQPEEKTALFKRIMEQYPDSNEAKAAKGEMRKAEGLGKPFELTFTDAISGKELSVQRDLKGKVIVVDFWATWCGPCVAEMPKMKKLYSEFKDQGVEFIGVSLDQSEEKGKGLTKLKEFVAKNEIAWPQYYQGNYWQSEFSSSWGINSIPAIFVIDAEGKLHSTNARGKLEQLLPELIKKRDEKTIGG